MNKAALAVLMVAALILVGATLAVPWPYTLFPALCLAALGVAMIWKALGAAFHRSEG